MVQCEVCSAPITDLVNAWVRVTGWGRGSKNGVKELFEVSAPHGYLCETCGLSKKNGWTLDKGEQTSLL